MKNNNNLQENILNYILSSGFSCDDTIREVDLAEKFGISVTPVREALNNLEEKGFIERRKRKGTYLKFFSLKELADLYYLRSVLEGLAARLLCDVAAPGIIDELVELSEEYEKNKPSRKRSVLSQIDYRFHSRIVESCGNERLIMQIKESHVITKFFAGGLLPEFVPARALKNPYTHVRIVSALEKRDAALAERLMRKHVEWAKDNMIKSRIRSSLTR